MKDETKVLRAQRIAETKRRLEAIERALPKAGLSINALCKEAGFTNTRWYHWKEGKSAPRPKMWEKIKNALPPKLRKLAA